MAQAIQRGIYDARPETGRPRPQVHVILTSSPPIIDLTGPMPSRCETPPEEKQTKGCSLISMEPLSQWFCRGAYVFSCGFEAARQRLEKDPPDVMELNDNTREER